VGALLAAPILVARYPPMTDLPLYEGALAVLRRFRDPAFVPPGVYELNLGRTTQLAFAVGLPLTYLMSTAAASKVLVASCVLAMVVGVGRLARHVGVTPWVSLLAAPVVLGWVVFIGMMAYLLGTALWLLALPALDRWVEAPTARRGALACAIVAALHFAHLASSACAVLALVALTAAHGWERRAPVRLLPAVLAVALAVVDRAQDRAHAAAGALAWEERGLVWAPLHAKLSMVPSYLFGAVGGLPQLLIVALLAVAVLASAVGRRPRPPSPPLSSPLAVRWRFAWVAMALVVTYAAGPFSVGAGAYFDARFLPPAWLVGAVVVGQAVPLAATTISRIAAAIVPVAWVTAVWPAFADADREQSDLAELYPHVEPLSAVAVLGAASDSGGPYVRASAGNRVLAERGGRLLYSLAEAPRSPVLLRPAVRWDESVNRLHESGVAFVCPPFDAARYRYLLIRVGKPELGRAVMFGLEPDYKLEATAGPWALFRSTHPTVPLDAPEEAAPADCIPLAARAEAAARASRSP
jgi:hypothetical protein